MGNIVLYIVAVFFLIGAIDYIEGNRLKLGEVFANGIKTMGALGISMIGILSLIPFFSKILNEVLVPVARKVSLDASIFAGSLIAIDMGGFNLSKDLASSVEMGQFSGILMASILGCTISFTLPLSIGLVKKENLEILFKGILCGIITMPIGLLIGGFMLNVPIVSLVYNLIPVIIIAILLAIGIIFATSKIIFIFRCIGKGITFISVLGLIIQGIKSICGITLLDNLMPLSEVLTIVGKIAIFLGGAYVMLEVIKMSLSKFLEVLSKKLSININSITALIGSLASAIVIFADYDKLDDNGKIICTAFSVGGAYVFGGQMGYVSSVSPESLHIYIAVKLLCGIFAIIFAMLFIKYENKNKAKV